MTKRRWKWARRLALGAMALAVLACAGGLVWLRAGQSADAARLKAITDRLDADDPGWRFEELTAARNAALPPPETSVAGLVGDAAAAIPQSYSAWRTAPLSAVQPVWDGRPTNRPMDPDQVAELEGVLAPCGEALRLARQASGRPPGGAPYTGSGPNPLHTPSPGATAARDAAYLLRSAATLRSARADPAGALADCRAMLDLVGGGIGDEPAVWAQSIRVGVAESVATEAERVLAWNEAAPEALAELQARLLQECDAPRALWGYRGERALAFAVLKRVESGESLAVDATGYRRAGPPAWSDRLGSMAFRPVAVGAQAEVLASYTNLVAALKLPDPARHTALASPPRHGPRDGNPFHGDHLAWLVAPAPLRLADADARLRARLSCAVAGLACERFRLKVGRWPSALGELVPGLLAAVPLDPYAGGAVGFRLEADGASVFAAEPAVKRQFRYEDTPGGEVSFRLWNPGQRRLPPAPKPDPAPAE